MTDEAREQGGGFKGWWSEPRAWSTPEELAHDAYDAGEAAAEERRANTIEQAVAGTIGAAQEQARAERTAEIVAWLREMVEDRTSNPPVVLDWIAWAADQLAAGRSAGADAP